MIMNLDLISILLLVSPLIQIAVWQVLSNGETTCTSSERHTTYRVYRGYNICEDAVIHCPSDSSCEYCSTCFSRGMLAKLC